MGILSGIRRNMSCAVLRIVNLHTVCARKIYSKVALEVTLFLAFYLEISQSMRFFYECVISATSEMPDNDIFKLLFHRVLSSVNNVLLSFSFSLVG